MINGLNFSTAKPLDVVQIHALETQLFTDAWSINSLMHCITGGYEVILTHSNEYPTRILAYAVIDPGPSGRCGLAKLGVSPLLHGMGVGRQLLNHVIDSCQCNGYQSMNLRVRISNHVAIGLYESIGFQTTHIINDYYESPDEDAFGMLKKL